MAKERIVGIRHYYNGKLAPKLVDQFIGIGTMYIYYPIYVQVSYKRKATVFRSEFFPDPVLYKAPAAMRYQQELLNGLTPDYIPPGEAEKQAVMNDREIIEKLVRHVDGRNFSFKPFHAFYRLYAKSLGNLLEEYFNGELVPIMPDDQRFSEDLQYYQSIRQFIQIPPQFNIYYIELTQGKAVFDDYLSFTARFLGQNFPTNFKLLIARVKEKVLKNV